MQAYQAYAQPQQNKGTLVPGQSIAVNKYTVQVERYLSQGGFAHVYLVRTATPVYGTTHHVLKRIAVANDAMLTEVKQEVDIMRLLKGHPNIVHLIDAAWHKLSNGTYEVFILMEFCPGGGIIDMMNRRLRERLTEAEILQIFVDVCEGVAYMHNSRPPLLHRDLKVENILQSSPTSFKLCDFGSAATVRRPPTNMQEIRAVEADLNRHTTLQYRAPEMVDPYQRRPIDEKSDVWALGVLLYKLCYYTTPFEEHGPLAILNVQYRIPPYPVYSANMNALIASMLREHGTQRPSVFEVLVRVHSLRGTKSQFNYVIPAAQPLAPTSSRIVSPLDNTISYRSSGQAKAANPGVQARDKVLEAIAPMRRGRPAVSHERSKSKSRPTTPSREQSNWLDGDFNAAEDKAWQAVSSQSASPAKKSSTEDAWAVHANAPAAAPQTKAPGFGDDFAEKLWDTFDPKVKAPHHGASLTNNGPSLPSSLAPKGYTMGNTGSNLRRATTVSTKQKDKDAFEGLGISSSSNEKPAPTLGEARKLRTGLANDQLRGASPQPSPSPRPNYLAASASQPESRSPIPSPNSRPGTASWRPSPSPAPTGDRDAESRFPSLEELDKTFGTPGSDSAPRLHPMAGSQPNLEHRTSDRSESRAGQSSRTGASTFLRPSSAHVTGVAMRDRDGHSGDSALANAKVSRTPLKESPTSPTRPALMRKHRSSMSIKHSPQPSADDYSAAVRPVVRQSPSKRASVMYMSVQEPSQGEQGLIPAPSPRPSPAPAMEATASTASTASAYRQRAERMFPPLDIDTDASSVGPQRMGRAESKGEPPSSADEGPEDAVGFQAAKRSNETPKPRHKGRQSSVHDSEHEATGACSESPAPTSPSSARSSRPQSMFLFPSQSPEVPAPAGNSLVPPEAPKQRANVRRTSISDMVQRYEAIGGKVKPVSAPSPVTTSVGRPTGLKAPAQMDIFTGSNGRDNNLPLPEDPTGRFTDTSRQRTSPTGLPARYSPGPSPTTTGMPRTSPMMQPRELKQETKLPYKPRVRKPSASPSTSVGKLIQQWQQKQEEADPARDAAKRGGNGGGLVAGRRAGLVAGSGRGQ
ncbi:hypothetical protein BD626DRAFT_546292 [Schizophyllum amplum]|uniref:non-specific serine/threonine protein kinase n=1 Tax=Schizophyllum amplum TaxID=97359 RepID=A0A550CM59_9AGAR|nr:hypothetical protein BD626DRAFT_546292 [Auriculariopsis ampla]